MNKNEMLNLVTLKRFYIKKIVDRTNKTENPSVQAAGNKKLTKSPKV